MIYPRVRTRMHETILIALPLTAVVACVPPRNSARAATVVRAASYPDAVLAARQEGRLEVVIHPTDQPTQVVVRAQVLLRLGPRDSVAGITDERGVARFDSVAIGEHELIVRRIGFQRADAIVSVKPGCRTDVEAYIAISAMGIAPPPPMPGRVIQTTCR